MRLIDADIMMELVDRLPFRNNEDIKNFIEVQPTVDVESQWIPGSERLPNKYERVLITVRYSNDRKDRVVQVGWGFIDGYGNWFWHYTEDYGFCKSEVLAWMPLPEPYKETE